jgi:hypothetical protein
MPRPRKNDPTPIVKPILLSFAREIAGAVEQMTLARVRAVLDGGSQHAKIGRIGRGGGKRAQQHCYYPGCKNLAAPRYGMFCVAEHKNLSATEKERYRKQHAAGTPQKASAARRGRKK